MSVLLPLPRKYLIVFYDVLWRAPELEGGAVYADGDEAQRALGPRQAQGEVLQAPRVQLPRGRPEGAVACHHAACGTTRPGAGRT